MKRYADKLLANAKSKPDPKNKDDPDFNLYKLRGIEKEGKRDEGINRKSLRVETEVDHAQG
eukprot:3652200-Alexandrium_andersonii.AAC.1